MHSDICVVVKIMVPFWIPIRVRHLILGHQNGTRISTTTHKCFKKLHFDGLQSARGDRCAQAEAGLHCWWPVSLRLTQPCAGPSLKESACTACKKQQNAFVISASAFPHAVKCYGTAWRANELTVSSVAQAGTAPDTQRLLWRHGRGLFVKKSSQSQKLPTAAPTVVDVLSRSTAQEPPTLSCRPWREQSCSTGYITELVVSICIYIYIAPSSR